MPELYGPRGEIISSFADARDKKPLVGEIVTPWNGDRYLDVPKLPSQMNLGFDSSKLTLPDYRLMREHHQVSSSLNLLSMMMYQRDFRIVGDSPKVNKHCTENMREIWPRLVRAMSKAFWAGFSPNALQWENDIVANKLWLTKIKDLKPEDCKVRWKEIVGVAEKKPRMQGVKHRTVIYDGILQAHSPDIPVSNSFWYPFMMEEGDHYGRKLLDAVFRPWYFSMVMHLYANRYMERFAEPTPVGRAPFDESIEIGGKMYSGNKLMGALMQMQRNGSSIILPNSRTKDGINGDSTYDYLIEYLDSTVKGAEFDRIIQMYDEEISLGLFTPLLLTRNTDTGSSNLGVVHTKTWHTLLNAIAGDWKEYIDRYILKPMAIENFGKRAKIPQIDFRPLGRTDAETARAALQALMGANRATVDLEELGAVIGLTVNEVREVTPDEDDADPAVIKRTPSGDDRVGRPGKNKTPTGTDKVAKVAAKIAARVKDQAARAYGDGTFGVDYEPDLGHRKQFVEALAESGVDEFDAGDVYAHLQVTCTALADEGTALFPTPAEFTQAVEDAVNAVAGRILDEVENAQSVAV